MRECASACSSITAQTKTKTDHITLGEPEEYGVTLQNNSGTLLVRMTRLLGFLLRNRNEISTADLTVWTYVMLRVQQHCTVAVVFYELYQSYDCVRDSEPTDYVLTTAVVA